MAEHAQHHHSADDQYLETPPGAGYEHTDVSVGVMVHFAIWLIASAVVVHLGLAAMYWFLIKQSVEPATARAFPMATSPALTLPPEPRLQQSGSRDLYDFRLTEDADLHSYGWVDKNAGTVHIPIEDAMRLMLERGALSSRPAENAKVAETHGMMPSDSSSGRVLEKRRQ